MKQQLLHTIQTANELLAISQGHSRYHIEIEDCHEQLNILSYMAEEELSKPWHYIITLTCANPNIDISSILLRPAIFTFQTPVNHLLLPVRKIAGVINDFRLLATSADETRYRLRLVPRLALLQHTVRSEIRLKQSVPQVVEAILREHGLLGEDFEFRLTRHYPARKLITQWKESDLAFIERILAEVGILYRFEMNEAATKEVMVLQDSQRDYQFGTYLPLTNPSDLEDQGVESLWNITCSQQVISGQVTIRDYNYRQALTPQQNSVTTHNTEKAVYGEVYRYAEPFLSGGEPEITESGAFHAMIYQQRLLSTQYQVNGCSSYVGLVPGMVIDSQDKLPGAIVDGILITDVHSRGSRSRGIIVEFSGIPYQANFCWRPALHARPRIAGTLPARIESNNRGDLYGWLDSKGRYRVKVDYDRNNTERGYAYLWLRLARSYAGDGYGWHAPLLDGTEVAIAFDGGDIDRPYIAGAHHDSEHINPVTADNHTRNVWRTAANNKLRMEDKRSQEHIKLATDFGKTQLNLGHVTDKQRQQRGSGFELRTDECGAVRAAGGLLLMADGQSKGEGPVLQRDKALKRVKQTNSELKHLNTAAKQAGAIEADLQYQLEIMQEKIAQLQSALIVASAPEGVLFTSRKEIEMSSKHSTIISAGRNLDIGASKKMVLKAKDSIGLFANSGPARLVANQGEVKIEAQHNTMSLTSRQELTITSTEDEITIVTPKTLTLNGGGSYLKLSAEGIEQGTEGNFIVKSGQYLVTGKGASMTMPLTNFTKSEQSEEKTESDGGAISE